MPPNQNDNVSDERYRVDEYLSFPPIPEHLPVFECPENSLTVLEKRYLRRGPDGKTVEQPCGMFWRVSYHIASAFVEEYNLSSEYLAKKEPEVDVKFNSDVDVDAGVDVDVIVIEKDEEAKNEEQQQDELVVDPKHMAIACQFYELLVSRKFFPNSPTFTGAGTALGQLAACFVLPIDDDMGRTKAGIFQTLRNAALVQQTGGGNGFSFSRLRPKGAFVKSSGGTSSGPIGFLKVYDQAFGMVAQGGTRRGANMAVLRVDHPDIKEFITCKTDESAITNFNISVGITDEFMRAVELDTLFNLVAPHNGKVIKEVKARELWDLIVKHAHKNGEPGVLFLDAANRQNPLPHLYVLEATNPCGEQWLGPNENCCLGSVNLAQFFGPDGTVDWEGIKEAVFLSTIFLDNIVEKNAYVPEVPELREAALKSRRIGLGFMGLADLMLHCGVRYGSDQGEEFAAQVTEWLRFWCMDQSIRLALERKPFPAIKGSIYDAEYLKTVDGDKGAHTIIPENVNPWTIPQPITPYRRDFGRPAVDWKELRENLKKHGIRNACQMTVAPTGTIATVAGCEGYGCEPVFGWAYTRHVNDNGVDLKLPYVSPMFMAAMDKAGLSEVDKQRVIDRTMVEGTCQSLKALLPQNIRHAFVASMDITAEEHVRMQAAIQAFIDNSMSKTCNLPEGATKEDVARAYQMAWKLGCKGLTVYVTGSRQVVVLETKKEADKKADALASASASANQVEDDKGKHEYVPPQTDNLHDTIGPLSTNSSMDDEPQPVARTSEGNPTVPMFPINMKDGKKVRPRYLRGGTFTVDTPVGKTFVAVNELDDDPFECFVNTAKAGSQTAAVSEALARLVSYVLRIESPVKPRSRLREVWDQLRGIGGDRSRGWGARRVSSLPDGMAHAFAAYLDLETKQVNVDVNLRVTQNPSLPEETEEQEVELHKDLAEGVIGDLCSECGQASLINEEGCRKCYSCSYSEC